MATITFYGRETTRVAADSSLVRDTRTCSLVNKMRPPTGVKLPGYIAAW